MGVCKLLLGRVDDFSLEGGEPSVPKGVCMGGGQGTSEDTGGFL